MAEEADHISRVPDPRVDPVAADLFRKVAAADRHMRDAIGDDLYYGRRLYGDLVGRGFIDLGAEGRLPMGRGGEPLGQLWRLGYTQHRDRIVATGLVSPDEVDTCIELFNDPGFIWMECMFMAVWGRRPA